MTLVPSPLLRLNGNRKFVFLLFSIGSIFSVSCSAQNLSLARGGRYKREFPKGSPFSRISMIDQDHRKEMKRNESLINLALLLPFDLNQINTDPNSPNLHNTIENNSLIWDFYQGFVLALDSVGRYNQDHGLKGIDLQVLDTGEDSLKIKQILSDGSLDPVDLVVGPLYPDQIKLVADYSTQKRKFFVSPISPQPLSNFNHPFLIMMNSPLEAYSQKTVNFIQEQNPVANILILESSPQDTVYNKPMVSHFIYPPKIIKLNINQIGSEKIPLSQNLPNVIIVPSLDKNFWSKLFVYLGNLGPNIQFNVFAHPNFPRLNFIDQDLLQNSHVHYPSNSFIDKDAPETLQMQNLYKSRFQNYPSQYSYLGYDIGLYFGRTLTSWDSIENSLIQNNWRGIHNDFRFSKDPKLGFQNLSIKMLEYINNTLQEDK